jgi:ribosomal protein S18 acetylase RimI-like enzyme
VRGDLVPIDESNWRAALLVRVGEEQLRLVAEHQPVALVVLAKAFVQPGGRTWEPLAFVVDGHVVAVVALAHGDRIAEMVNLAVDVAHQRRGIGSALVAAAINRARRSGLEAMELTVHPDNESAIALYRASGFSPTGDHRDGEPVWRFDL